MVLVLWLKEKNYLKTLIKWIIINHIKLRINNFEIPRYFLLEFETLHLYCKIII